MPTCRVCKRVYDPDQGLCPDCEEASAAARTSGNQTIDGFARFGLVVGMIVSGLGVPGATISGVLSIVRGDVIRGFLLLLLAAPYSYAMLVVFQHVKNRSK